MWSSSLGQKCEQKKHKDDEDGQADPEADHYRVYKIRFKHKTQDMMNMMNNDSDHSVFCQHSLNIKFTVLV